MQHRELIDLLLREGYIVFPDLHVFYKETRDNWFSFVYLSV